MRAVDDTAWDRVGWEHVRQAAPADNEHASVLVVVERGALEGGYPIQIAGLREASRRPFRCIARELWRVDDNLNIANMDWGSSQEEQTARVTSGGCLTFLLLRCTGNRLRPNQSLDQTTRSCNFRSGFQGSSLIPGSWRSSGVLFRRDFGGVACCWAIKKKSAQGIGIILPRHAPVAACIHTTTDCSAANAWARHVGSCRHGVE